MQLGAATPALLLSERLRHGTVATILLRMRMVRLATLGHDFITTGLMRVRRHAAIKDTVLIQITVRGKAMDVQVFLFFASLTKTRQLMCVNLAGAFFNRRLMIASHRV